MTNRITRRDFIKGLLAMSASTALLDSATITGTAWDMVDTAFEEDTINLQRPWGRLGSVRIGDTWYSLQDAQFYHIRQQSHTIDHPNSLFPDQPFCCTEFALYTADWQVDLFLGEDGARFSPFAEAVEFEIDTRHSLFQGTGYVVSHSSAYSVDEIEYSVSIEGISKFYRIN